MGDPEGKDAGSPRRLDESDLRRIYETAVDYAIITLDAQRRVTSWSPGARALFGYEEAEAAGRSADLIFTPEDRLAGVPEEEARTALREGRADDDRWHLRKDGSRFYASGVMRPMEVGGAPGFLKVVRDLTERKEREQALQGRGDELEARVAERTADLAEANARLRVELAMRDGLRRRLAAAQEAERLRLSRELHDSVGQLLAGLSMSIKATREAGPLTHAAVVRLEEAGRLIDELGREVHSIAVRLRPTALDDLGLGPALESLASEWGDRHGIRVDVAVPAMREGRLPGDVETVLYRVVQEALTNVAKHAHARSVSVVVGRQKAHVVMVVEDDGVGFDPAGAGAGRLGMLGMRERLAQVGGTLEVESQPGRGAQLIARIPLEERPPAGST